MDYQDFIVLAGAFLHGWFKKQLSSLFPLGHACLLTSPRPLLVPALWGCIASIWEFLLMFRIESAPPSLVFSFVVKGYRWCKLDVTNFCFYQWGFLACQFFFVFFCVLYQVMRFGCLSCKMPAFTKPSVCVCLTLVILFFLFWFFSNYSSVMNREWVKHPGT